jgi:hypothetical protein
MSLPNTEFTPPNYKVARICKNCFYYSPTGSGIRGRYIGICKLQTVADPEAHPRPSHGTCVCDAHVFKRHYKTIYKLHHDFNAAIPDDREM